MRSVNILTQASDLLFRPPTQVSVALHSYTALRLPLRLRCAKLNKTVSTHLEQRRRPAADSVLLHSVAWAPWPDRHEPMPSFPLRDEFIMHDLLLFRRPHTYSHINTTAVVFHDMPARAGAPRSTHEHSIG